MNLKNFQNLLIKNELKLDVYKLEFKSEKLANEFKSNFKL